MIMQYICKIMLIACDHMGKKAHDLNVRKIMQKTNESWKKKKKNNNMGI